MGKKSSLNILCGAVGEAVSGFNKVTRQRPSLSQHNLTTVGLKFVFKTLPAFKKLGV